MASDMILELFGILVVSLLMGILLQRSLVHLMHRAVQKTKWQWDDIVIESLGKMPLLWSLLAGAYVLINYGRLRVPDPYWLEKILLSLVILSLTVFCARVIGAWLASLASSTKGRLPETTLLVNGSRLIVYVVGLILVLQNLDVEITPLITALGLGGLAVALALEDTLNNLFSGVQIITSQFVRPGDYVKLDSGHEGYVTDVKARNTTIRSFPNNNRIIVPNSVLASSTLINYSLPEQALWIDLVVGVAYDSDLEHVEKVSVAVAQDVLASVEGGMPDHDPVLCYEEFGDSSINFRIRVFVKEFRDQFLIKHEFIKRLHQRYNQEGIEIPFPIRTLVFKNQAEFANPATDPNP